MTAQKKARHDVGAGRTGIAVPVLVTLISVAAATVVAQARPVPVTGTWEFTIRSEQGTGMPTVTFKQDGTKLTGRYTGALFGEADLKGTLKGTSITFTVFAQWQGTRQDMFFTGDYDGKGAINGTYMNDFGSGKFTAARKLRSSRS